MTKTKEELKKLKQEYETLQSKLEELSEEELKTLVGGTQECDEFLANSLGHGKNGKPSLPLWDEASSGLIQSSNTVSPEETLGGKIYIVPTDESYK